MRHIFEILLTNMSILIAICWKIYNKERYIGKVLIRYTEPSDVSKNFI